MLYKKINFIILFSIILNSCGYKPIYLQENKESLLKYHSISIAKSNNKIGKSIREELLKKIRVDQDIPSKYILDIQASSNSIGIVTNINTRIVRYEVEVVANYTLYEKLNKNKGKVIINSSLSRRASHRVLPNNITATLASEKTATSKTIQLIANDIHDQLILTILSKK